MTKGLFHATRDFGVPFECQGRCYFSVALMDFEGHEQKQRKQTRKSIVNPGKSMASQISESGPGAAKAGNYRF